MDVLLCVPIHVVLYAKYFTTTTTKKWKLPQRLVFLHAIYILVQFHVLLWSPYNPPVQFLAVLVALIQLMLQTVTEFQVHLKLYNQIYCDDFWFNKSTITTMMTTYRLVQDQLDIGIWRHRLTSRDRRRERNRLPRHCQPWSSDRSHSSFCVCLSRSHLLSTESFCL